MTNAACHNIPELIDLPFTNSRPQLKAGVIGTGSVARTAHLPTYANRDDTTIVAVADLDAEMRREAAQDFDVERTHSDGLELIESETLDIVSICTPPATHEELFVAAVERGCNVYCEKPMTTSTQSAERMVDAATENDVITQIGYTRAYVENFKHVLSIVANNLLGDIQRLDTYRVRNPPAAGWNYDPSLSGGGVVSDQLPHILDFYFRLFDDTDPAVKSSALSSVEIDDVEDFAELEFEFGDASVRTTLGWSPGAKVQQNVLIGTKGSLEFDMTRLEGRVQGSEFEMKYGEPPFVDIDGLLRLWWGGENTFHQTRVNDFVDHVGAGDPETVAPVKRGYEVTRTIQEVYEGSSYR